jgi:repressor LexA
MPESLTDLERAVLDYLVDYLRRNTYQPSIREIGRTFAIKSTKTVSEILQSLALKGYIERDASRSRGVRVLGLAMDGRTVSVPAYGARGPGGGPPEEAFELDRKLAGATGTFCVSMPNDAMAGEGIRSKDLLLVEPVADAVLEEGDLVLAHAAGNTVVRRLAVREGRRVLVSTRDQPALDVAGEDVSISGRVIGVVRQLRVPHRSPVLPADQAGSAS